MRIRGRITVVGLLAAGATALGWAVLARASGEDGIAKRAARGQLKAAVLKMKVQKDGQEVTVTRTLPFLSAGTVVAAQQALGISAGDDREEAADAAGTGQDLPTADLGSGPGSLGCPGRDSNGNKRVNQDCSFRRQAEETITFNPLDPNELLAGQNDSRVGFNQCGIDWSTDNGKHWGDLLPPFRQKLNEPFSQEPTASDPNRHTIGGGPGTEHTYDAASDPAVAIDAFGRGYFSCVVFDILSNASALFVTQSPPGAHGSFFFNVTFRQWMVAEDNNGLVFHDKNFIAADRDPNGVSPNKGNVYVTWTVFRFDQSGSYQQSPIFGSMSTDGGRHFSTPEDISGSSDTLCFFGNFFDPTLGEHKCDFNQGSDPIVLPNGDLEVIFNNGNTPAGNPNGQQLGVHCHPTGNSATGTAHLNCVEPAKVGNDIITGEPQCDFGRGPEECIPGAYIRTNDFPRISRNTENGHLYAVWQDYRNQEYDIQLSISTDSGLTWHEAGTVNPDRGLDHYFPAVDKALTANGFNDRVGVSYYRTERVPNENTTPTGGFLTCNPNQGGDPTACSAGVGLGNSDYVLAGGTGAQTPYDFKVVSPVFAPPDGAQTGFNGDYSGLTINKGTDAHPIWSDTRNVDPYAPANGVIHDEDIFTDNVGLPNGQARVTLGATIGHR
ncbi:MAG: hypothetical protein E6J58_15475 [Deltaproteobacteria bacterium]|nr:MAG: hypothetical protein E6J67_11710 [Deltaproteobacteria bacterium]TMB35597.1 MAG: hypothetical protein E6J58_15475 [Deltaproteobacteria bacterium]